MVEGTSRAGRISVVIRCFNEEKHLGRLLESLGGQTMRPAEIVIVDSGSTDRCLAIAARYPARVVGIDSSEFTFGRSLNRGCAAATGDVLVLASAHVYPVGPDWLERLTEPLSDPGVGLVYGRQVGCDLTRFSEHQVFLKHFPPVSDVDQRAPFCNNANAAIRRSQWERHPYDESLTGLEDVAWGVWAKAQGLRIVYSAEAAIVHVHEERAAQIRRRYKREAIALRQILPDSHMAFTELAALLSRAVALDAVAARRARRLLRELPGIVVFRLMQYWGTYRGLHYRSTVTRELLYQFYYPVRSDQAEPKPGDPGLPSMSLTEPDRAS